MGFRFWVQGLGFLGFGLKVKPWHPAPPQPQRRQTTLPHWHRARCISCAARARPPKPRHRRWQRINVIPRSAARLGRDTRKTLQSEIMQFFAASLWAPAPSLTSTITPPAQLRSVASESTHRPASRSWPQSPSTRCSDWPLSRLRACKL